MKKKRISRKDFLKSAGLLGIGGLAINNTKMEDKKVLRPEVRNKYSNKKKPNVLIVFDDQLRRDALGVFGGGYNFTTPNIDRLASEGMSFRQNVSTCPLCTPFRGMLQTGRYPTHSGIIFNFIEASYKQNPNCIANIFSGGGYETGFIGKWHLAKGFRVVEGLFKEDLKKQREYREQNPDTEFVAPGASRLGYDFWQAYNFHGAFNNYWFYEDRPPKIETGRFETDVQFDQAIDFMEERKDSDNPFFLMVAPHPPHEPFKDAPEEYKEKVVSKNELRWDPNVPKDNPRKSEDIRGYYAMIKNLDDNMGRLLDYMDKSELSEDTILIFTSDHGGQHGSHGRLQKMVPYRESMNVPLIIRWPDHIEKGKFTYDLFSPMDFFPTLCGMVGLDIPEEVDGVDLSDTILNGQDSDRKELLIMNYTSHWDFLQTQTLWPEWRGVYTGQYTYVRWLSGEEELYNNDVDPYQLNNLINDTQFLAIKQDLRERMRVLLNEAHDDFRPGSEYAEWFNEDRTLRRTGLGDVPSH